MFTTYWKRFAAIIMVTASNQSTGIQFSTNYNTVPFDPRKPFDPSGIRLGTPALTTRGLKEADLATVADFIDRAILSKNDDAALIKVKAEVADFCKRFPMPH